MKTKTLEAAALKAQLRDGQELALLDVREGADFGQAHLLYAVNLPLARLELHILTLVPRLTTRVVLCDGGTAADGEASAAAQAAQKLTAWGYSDVAVLAGGTPAWKAAGYELFSGVNVPSKAFGEIVEHRDETPSISAEELNGLMEQGRKLVVLDSRPMPEFHSMSIPSGIDCPGAELVYRARDLAPDADTLVVVNCAGRTRSIIGAQSLRNAGLPNEVVALRNGTMGWHLAGYTLAHGATQLAPAPSAKSLRWAQEAARGVAKKHGVQHLDAAGLQAWLAEARTRTCHVLDVRLPEEFEAGHLPGSRNAPGGQLVQATDVYVAVRNARLVLVDDSEVRALMTASWLKQLGWPEVAVLIGGIAAMQAPGHALRQGPAEQPLPVPENPRVQLVDAKALRGALTRQSVVVLDFATSLEHKAGHIPHSWFGMRGKLAECLKALPAADLIVFTSPDGVLARLAAEEAWPLTRSTVRALSGGTQAWAEQGLPVSTGMENRACDPADVFLRPYDRDQGVEAAMKDYLSWEVGLVEQVQRDGDAPFIAQ